MDSKKKKPEPGESILEQFFNFTHKFDDSDTENDCHDKIELLSDSGDEKPPQLMANLVNPRRNETNSTLTENITFNSNKKHTFNQPTQFSANQMSKSKESDSTLTENFNFFDDSRQSMAPPKSEYLSETVHSKTTAKSDGFTSYLTENPFGNSRHYSDANNNYFAAPIADDLTDRQSTQRFLRQNDALLCNFYSLEKIEMNKINRQAEAAANLDDQNSNDEDEDDAQIVQSSTCMCMIHQSQRFACAVYDFNSKSLSYLSDCEDDSSFSLANLLISDLQPGTVITCTTGDDDFIKYLKVKCKYNNLDDNNANFLRCDTNQKPNASGRHHSIQFVMMANADFSYKCACEQISQIDTLEEMPAMVMSEQERALYMKSAINFDSKHMIRCMGALLTYLQRNIDDSNEDSQQTDSLPILTIKAIKLNKLLTIDQNTYKSLQIFNDVDLSFANRQVMPQFSGHFRSTLNFKMDSHSTLYSLYLNKIHTKVGIAKLRSFMLRPVRDPSVINERHTLIEFFMDRHSHRFVELLRKSLKQCKFINALFKKMRTSSCSLNEWRKLYRTTASLYDLSLLGRMGSTELKKRKRRQQLASETASFSANMTNDCFDSTRSKYFTNEPLSDQFSSINVSLELFDD
jgi:hypothetical protein